MDSKQIDLKQEMSCNPGFEGVEKNLKVEFLRVHGVDCRQIPRKAIDAILTEARCTIIGSRSTQFFDSYVLSESSLFIYPHKIILKTCGTTRLLSCLPVLLDCAKQVGAQYSRVQFSRCNFIFPHVQPTPHCSFTMEVEHLDQHFTGTPYILGPINGPRWHLYFDDLERNSKPNKEQILEIAMFELNRDSMKYFYGDTYSYLLESKESKESVEAWKKYAGELATQRSGISSILPEFDIDYHLFSPCGYSCNGLKDEYYFTIHVTPEPHCSFVSFETNVSCSDYNDMINKVLSVFRPTRFCVLTAEDGSKSRAPAWFDGFASAGKTQLTVGTTRVVSTQFVKSEYEYHQDSVDCPSSDTDADAKGDKSDQKKKKRKKRCKKKKKKSPSSFFVRV